MVAALIWHDTTPGRVARERLGLGTMHLSKRPLGIVLDAVHESDHGRSARQNFLAGVDELGNGHRYVRKSEIRIMPFHESSDTMTIGNSPTV